MEQNSILSFGQIKIGSALRLYLQEPVSFLQNGIVSTEVMAKDSRSCGSTSTGDHGSLIEADEAQVCQGRVPFMLVIHVSTQAAGFCS